MLKCLFIYVILCTITIITISQPTKIYQPVVHTYNTYEEAFYNLHRAFGVNKVLFLISDKCKHCDEIESKILGTITNKHLQNQIYVYEARITTSIKALIRYYDSNGVLLEQIKQKDQGDFDITPLIEKIKENKIEVVQKSNRIYKVEHPKILQQIQANIDNRISQLKQSKKSNNGVKELHEDQQRNKKNKDQQHSASKQHIALKIKSQKGKVQNAKKDQNQIIKAVQNSKIQQQKLNKQIDNIQQKQKQQLNNLQQKSKQISVLAEKSKQLLDGLIKEKAKFEDQRQILKEQQKKDKKHAEEVFEELKQKIQRSQQNLTKQEISKGFQLTNFNIILIGSFLALIVLFLYRRSRKDEQIFVGVPSAQAFQMDELRT